MGETETTNTATTPERDALRAAFEASRQTSRPQSVIPPAPPPPPPPLLDGRPSLANHPEVITQKGPLGNRMRVSSEVQLDHNGMKASDYLNPANVPQSLRDAVREDREARGVTGPTHPATTPLTPLGQPFVIFKHTEFTEEEDEVILNGILAGIPLYLIADKIKTSRGNLSKHIKESPLLSQAWVDRDEGLLDHVEYQAKRLVDSGNPAMIMFWLERKGKSRGWGTQDIIDVEPDDTRIVIGEIPEAECAGADRVMKKGAAGEEGIRLGAFGLSVEQGPMKKGAGATTQSPMQIAQEMQAQKEMKEEREAAEAAREAARREAVESSITVDAHEASPAASPEPGGTDTAAAIPDDAATTPDDGETTTATPMPTDYEAQYAAAAAFGIGGDDGDFGDVGDGFGSDSGGFY